MGSQIQKSGETIKRLTDWHHIWYTSADSSGNGHRLNIIRSSILQGAFQGVVWGHKFKYGKAAKRLDRLDHIWYTSVDSSGNGHRLKTIRLTIPQGGIGGGGGLGSTIQKTGKCGQTVGPIGILNCAHIMQMNLGMVLVEQSGPIRHQGEHFDAGLSRGNFWGFRGVNISLKVWGMP